VHAADNREFGFRNLSQQIRQFHEVTPDKRTLDRYPAQKKWTFTPGNTPQKAGVNLFLKHKI
jgi:hypothetical protein